MPTHCPRIAHSLQVAILPEEPAAGGKWGAGAAPQWKHDGGAAFSLTRLRAASSSSSESASAVRMSIASLRVSVKFVKFTAS